MSKYLVTGVLGFIGSYFAKYVIDNESDSVVIGVNRNSNRKNFKRLEKLESNPRFQLIFSDLAKDDITELCDEVDYIINFAAKTFVDHSIRSPEPFIQSNIIGTFRLLEIARKSMELKKFVQISCYDEKTRALTPDGIKTYKELKEGDLVFSINPITQEIEIKPIEKVIIQSYDGEMIRFKNKRVDLLVTPNHNMFFLNTSKNKLLIQNATEMSKRSIVYMPEGKWIGKNSEFINIDGYGKVKTEDLMYLFGIFIGDGFTAYQEKEVETKTGLPKNEFLLQARDKKTGRFKKIPKQSDYKSTNRSYRIFFDIPENDKCRKKVEDTLTNLSINWHPHKGKAGTHLYFTSKIFMDLFNQCDQGAHNKHIPRWLLEYSPKYLKHLFFGLMDSDGHDGKIYTTVSEKLTSDLVELCIKLNLKPSIHDKHSLSYIDGRKIEGDSYYVYAAKTMKSISRNRSQSESYKGKIWCLRVKDNKNFLVERNGRFDFCGNTDEVYGSILKGAYDEKAPLNPSNPYSATKAGADALVISYHNTYGLPTVITRCENNYGPFQDPQKVFPAFIKKALRNEPLPIYGDGKHRRMWLHVEDHCRAIIHLLDKGKNGELYHIAGEEELENIELAKRILSIMNKPENLITFIDDYNIRPGHDRRYALNVEKLKSVGWKPQFNIEKGFEKTIDWYLQNKWWFY